MSTTHGTNSTADRLMPWVLLGTASIAIIVVVGIFVFLASEGLPLLWSQDWKPTNPETKTELSRGDALLSRDWYPGKEQYGLIPLITGSLLVTFLAIAMSVPFGVAGAVYISEFATAGEREFLKPCVETLAGIPSVVLGFFGLMVIAPAVQSAFGLDSGQTAITGAVLLAFMALPTIMSVSEDAIRAVPGSYRDASLALGGNPWQTTWRVVLPAASSGVTAAVLLGVGRVIGETMTVLMVCGNAPQITANPTAAVRTMTAAIAAEMGEVIHGGAHYRALFMVGLVLLVFTLCFNMLARYLIRRSAAK